MYELTDADMVWNRACGDDPLRALPGDCALVDLLYAHNLAMNGGVLNAVELMTAEKQLSAEAGYRYFGFDGIASLLSRARTIFEAANDLDTHEQRLDREYAQFVPSDSSLFERFESRFKANPHEFSSLRPKDRG